MGRVRTGAVVAASLDGVPKTLLTSGLVSNSEQAS